MELRRLKGIKPSLAVADQESGTVFVETTHFPIRLPATQLVRLLEKGGGPTRDSSRDPPTSRLLASNGARLPLTLTNYCWSTPSGPGWVQGCATTPTLPNFYDLPLVTARPGATIRARLGVPDPDEVTVRLIANDHPYYSEAMPASQALAWVVPTEARPSSFLEITVGRALSGAPQDSVAYAALLGVVPR